MQKKHEELFIEESNNYLGVIPFSKRWDNILMWSHYANHHKGFCTGFNHEKFISSGLFKHLIKVKYSNKFSNLNPLKDGIYKAKKSIDVKSKDWHYEKEYRFFKFTFPDILKDDDRKIKILDNFFTEIIIGLNTSENDKETLIDIGRQKKINVYEIVKVPFKFKINRKQII